MSGRSGKTDVGRVAGLDPVESDPSSQRGKGVSRRAFLQTVGFAAGAAALPVKSAAAQAASPANADALGPGLAKLTLKINGQAKAVEIEPRLTLLETLRDKLDLTGSKLVCDRGSCGGCTVLVDGESVCSCMMLAVDARGKEVTTIEGLAKADGTLDRVQEGFIEHDAQQCGFCTPGFVMRAHAFLKENPKPSLDEIKDGLSGNICRCGTYTHVFAAVMTASKKEA